MGSMLKAAWGISSVLEVFAFVAVLEAGEEETREPAVWGERRYIYTVGIKREEKGFKLMFQDTL